MFQYKCLNPIFPEAGLGLFGEEYKQTDRHEQCRRSSGKKCKNA